MKITCPQCGFCREVPRSKLPAGPVVAKCPKCECRFRFSAEDGAGAILPPKSWSPGEEIPSEEDIRKTASNAYAAEARRFEQEKGADPNNPWDSAPAPDGWLGAFYQSLLRVMFQPQIFFRFLNPAQRVTRPLCFFLIICIVQTLVERFWAQVIYSVLSGQAGEDPQMERLLELLVPEMALPVSLLFRTAILTLQLYIFSLLICFAYRLVARERVTFSLIFQILAYGAGPWLLCIIPVVGSLAGTLWGICCVAIGCKSALELTWPQTLVGFLPVFILLGPLLMQILRLVG